MLKAIIGDIDEDAASIAFAFLWIDAKEPREVLAVGDGAIHHAEPFDEVGSSAFQQKFSVVDHADVV